MKTRSLFLDGRMVRADAGLRNSLAPGIVVGKGVFETIRLYRGKILFWEDHRARLFNGLKTLKIKTPYSGKQLKRYLGRVIRANHFKGARLRLAVWKEGRRLRIAIVGQAFKGYPSDKYDKGFKAIVSGVPRKKTRFSHVKSMDYGCFHRAFMEAGQRQCDEAVLLNNRKELVEGSRTNLFFVKRNILYTPATRCGCLNGITRQRVIRSARQMGISCRTVAAGIRKLTQADEAFMTNSLMGIMPLTVINNKRIGRGTAGPLTRKLLSAYRTNAHSSCPAKGKSV